MPQAGASLLKTFRIYAAIAGILVLAFWFIFRISDPAAVDPLWIRIALASVSFALLGLSRWSVRVRERFPALVKGLLYLYTFWIIWLNAVNGFSPNYVVALLFVIAAIGVAVATGLRVTAPIIYYLSIATVATSIAVVQTPQTAAGDVGRLVVVACVSSMALVIYVATRASVVAQAQLSQSNEALRQRNRELQQFTSAASHDLREPLRKIQTFADLLRSEHGGELTSVSIRYLERIEAISAHMWGVVGALLDFSEVSEDTARFRRVDLSNTLDEVLDELRSEIEHTGTQIEVDHLPEIIADQAQMRILFLELLKNAIAFRKEDGDLRIWIGAEELVGKTLPLVRLTIRDNGTGFEQKYAARVFAPFERLQALEGAGGVGMGLTICRRIVSLHGGTMTVESTANAGTVFTIELPARSSTDAGVGQDTEGNAQVMTSGTKSGEASSRSGSDGYQETVPGAQEMAPSARGQEFRPSEKGQESPPSVEGQESASSEKGQESAPSAKGQESAPSAKGQEPAPSAKGQEPAPSAKRKESEPRSKGKDDGPIERER